MSMPGRAGMPAIERSGLFELRGKETSPGRTHAWPGVTNNEPEFPSC